MRYKIKPRLYIEEEQFWIFSDEIFKMNSSEIQDGIDSSLMVIEENQPEMSWGWEVFELVMHKESSILEYHGDFVTEIPTQEVLKMLKDYKKALEYFEDKN